MADNRYEQVIAKVFADGYADGAACVEFTREDLLAAVAALGLKPISNIGDVVSTFRFRKPMPDAITSTASRDHAWIIRLAGRGRYRFCLVPAQQDIRPNSMLGRIKVPDATPGILGRYALNDEQALLAKVRYNRLIDIFTGITCYSLQNHLRTTVPGMGQVETDELYVGVNRTGAHYVLPVQAKGGTDRLSIVQLEQDIALCADKFPGLICIAVGAQFMADGAIALMAFQSGTTDVEMLAERHYLLVRPEEMTAEDLAGYRDQAQFG